MTTNPEKQLVTMSGLPGEVATLVAGDIIISPDLELASDSLSSERHQRPNSFCSIYTRPINLIPPVAHKNMLQEVRQLGGIVVDFTRPDAVNRNAELYAETGVPFVMGTTGGDREKLLETVKRSKISAVIAPNMATPMVVLQAMLEFAANTFPNALEGWTQEFEESHQDTKKDTSGTAKAWKPMLESLGALMPGEINSIRDRIRQKNELHVRNLDAHAYHFVTLISPDRTTQINLSTKIDGRNVYVGGTLQAIRFLREKIQAGSQGEVFSMIDVLKGEI